jgi:hypothetical protein
MSGENNIFYVYIHKRLTDGKVFYVGKGKEKRAYSVRRSDWWKRVANKHGYIVEILFDNLSEQDAFQSEIDVIAELRNFNTPLVNMTVGGTGASGYRWTDEAKRKQSIIRSGTKLTESHKKQISETLSGRPLTKEHSEKISKSNIGKKSSPEHIKNLQNSHKGNSVKCSNGMVFKSMKEAARWLKELFPTDMRIHASRISKCCNHVSKNFCGFTWEYEGVPEVKKN